MTRGVAGDALQTAAANVAIFAVGFATGILAARLLGPTDRGNLAAIQTWPTFLAMISTLGLGEALVYLAGREPDRRGRYLGSTAVLGLAASAPIVAVGYFLMPTLLAAQSSTTVFWARCYLLLCGLYVLQMAPLRALWGRKDFGICNAFRLLQSLSWLAVLCIAWTLHEGHPQFLSNGLLIAYVLLCFPIWRATLKRVPGPYRPEPRQWGAMLRFGLPSITGNVPQMLNLRLDQMLMAALIPPRLLGLYAVAVAWSGAAQALLRALAGIHFAHIASLAHDTERQLKLFGRVVRMVTVLAIATGGCLLAFTPWGLPLLFGSRFKPAVPAALILTFASGVFGINLAVEEGLRGLGRPAMVLWAELAGLGITGLSLWLLLPRMGIMGAALASILSYSVVGVILIVQTRKVTGLAARALLRPSISEVRESFEKLYLSTRSRGRDTKNSAQDLADDRLRTAQGR